MADFTLLRPWWLVLLFLPLIFVYIDFAKHHKLQNFIREDIINYLTPKKKKKKVIEEIDEETDEPTEESKTISEEEQKQLIAKPKLWKKYGWLIVPYFFGVFALSGPAVSQSKNLFQSQENWVWVLDYSDSMLATDIQKTPRYKKVRYSLIQLLNASKAHRRIGLLAYTSDTYVVSPMTDDNSTIIYQLQELSPEIMPSKGSEPLQALEKAKEMLDRDPSIPGNILLVLDDVKNEIEVNDLTKFIKECPYPVYIFAIGTTMGSPIMINDKYLTDKEGNTVMAKSHLDLIQRVAKDSETVVFFETGGEAPRLESIYEYEHPKYKKTEKSKYIHKDIGYYFMFVALIACAGFIRNYFFVIAFAMILGTSAMTLPSEALAEGLTEEDAILYPNEYGYQLYTEEKYEEALKFLTDPLWRGNAYYRLERYEKALQEYQILGNNAEAKYNIGNCFAHLKNFDDAILAYNQALKLDRKHANAAYNKTIVIEFLRKIHEDNVRKQAIAEAQNDLDLNLGGDLVLLSPTTEGASLLQRRLILQQKKKRVKTPEQIW